MLQNRKNVQKSAFKHGIIKLGMDKITGKFLINNFKYLSRK